MNGTELSKIVNSLLNRPVPFMTDQQLALWIKACREMERNVRPERARRNWMTNRLEAEAENHRLQLIDAERRPDGVMLAYPDGRLARSS
jgi:hypothetical protein